ncbi:MAG: hypothetical protein IPJ61_20550 [Tessaracoccus sp.]|uniref:hypothetical protein n=1 Tax=Tessaracoccus sp. TaxID=1971211 RepID=UPI001EBF8816|nr:hypothetical protein [Tessaracoccus sp.]MBK7823379.1 hypothetical protein [Tessaracoccus sp.]
MTISRTYPVDQAGHTLRGDVAAAYLRALKAGMPAGGVDVFMRTLEEQRVLFETARKRGIIAARPTFHAPHVDGRALDFHTTTAGKYAPSAAFVWAMQGATGSSKPKAGERPRIRAFGFYRSVPSERWHLEYDRDLDKHRAADLAERLRLLGCSSVKAFQHLNALDPDGVDGPLTWSALLGATYPVAGTPTPVPDPVPVPTPAPAAVDFRAATYNAELKRFGGGPYSVDAAFVDDVLRPSVLLAQEVDEQARDSIRAATGFKVYPFGTVALFWDGAKYSWGDRLELDLGTPYHKMIATLLTSKRNGASFVAASVHIRASDAIGGSHDNKVAGKRADVAKVIAKLAQYPNVVVGGDWSSDPRDQLVKAGYRIVTPFVDTYDPDGFDPLDLIAVRGDIDDRTGGSEHATSASDHDGMVGNLTLRTPVPTS